MAEGVLGVGPFREERPDRGAEAECLDGPRAACHAGLLGLGLLGTLHVALGGQERGPKRGVGVMLAVDSEEAQRALFVLEADPLVTRHGLQS